MEHLWIPSSMQEAKIQRLPDTAYYLPNFITIENEATLLDHILSRPARDWTTLTKRRLQTYPSSLSNNRLIDAPLPSWLSEPIISRMTSIPLGKPTPSTEDKSSSPQLPHIFNDAPHAEPNHVLVNEYTPGQGIMPHEDGSAYHPIVATISLGAPIVLDVHEKLSTGGFKDDPTFRILQEPRSLLITTESLYSDYLHGIAMVKTDEGLNERNIVNWNLLGDGERYEGGAYNRETRISLTYRDVKKVIKAGRLIPGLAFGKR